MLQAPGAGVGSGRCGDRRATPPSNFTASNGGVVKASCRSRWAGDIYRGTSKIAAAIANTGAYIDSVQVRGSGTFVYKACNAAARVQQHGEGRLHTIRRSD